SRAAMAGDPLGGGVARKYGLEIGFGTWFLAASVPTLTAIVLLPIVLYRVIAPEVRATPDAPRLARAALVALGPLSRHEWIVTVTFLSMVTLWASASLVELDAPACARGG